MVAFKTKFQQIMYTYKSHVKNINFITKEPFQVALTKEAFLSALMKQQVTFSVVMYVEWHPHASVQNSHHFPNVYFQLTFSFPLVLLLLN